MTTSFFRLEGDRVFRALVDRGSDAIFVVDAGGVIRYASPSCERLFGFTFAEIAGREALALLHPGDADAIRRRIGQLPSGGTIELQGRFARKEDGHGWFEGAVSNWLHDPEINGLVLNLRDASERKALEIRLRLQQSISRTLAEESELAAAVQRILRSVCELMDWQIAGLWIAEENQLRCSQVHAAEGMDAAVLEKDCRERTFEAGEGLPGRVVAERTPAWIPDLDDDSSFTRRDLMAAYGMRAAFAFPILLEGRTLGVLEFFSAEPRVRDEQLIETVTTIGRQIGQYVWRKRDGEALRESEERYRTVAETASDGIVSIDERSRILLINSAGASIFGYSREELLGQSLTVLMPEYLRHLHRQGFGRYLDTGTRHIPWTGIELPGLHKSGEEMALEISFGEYSTGGHRYFTGVIRDIRERKRSEESLRHTQKLESLGILAGGIAHDFNNLLTGILGNASLAHDSLSSSNPNRPLLQDVISASQRAADLTRQLLAYAGKGLFVTEAVNLSVLVAEISELIQASIPKQVQVRLELDPELPLIDADPGQIQQIAMNLVINGAEAIPETAGTVIVSTRSRALDQEYIDAYLSGESMPPGKYAVLEVQDSGSGMDDDIKSRIFDPFFTTKFTGRGLGLAAVQGIVRGHKGAIRVYSAPGAGSTFKVFFPVSQQQKQSAGSSLQAGGAMHGTGTILVVDDEHNVRQTAKNALERMGYQVLIAHSGDEAVRIAKEQDGRIDAVLLDLTMPGMSGEEAFRQLKLIRPDLPVMLTSGFNEVEAARHFTGKGLAGFLQKPYTAAELGARMRSALRRD